MTIPEKALEIAITQLGVEEVPREVLWALSVCGFISPNTFYKIVEIAKKYPKYFK